MQRLEEHTFVNVQQQHSLQVEFTHLAIFHPRLILETSSSLPHQLQQMFCLRKEQDPEELLSNLCCNIQSECYYQLLETDCIENTDDVCIF